MLTDRMLSVIVACYRDGGSVQEMHQRLTQSLAGVTPHYEIIFVNDNSPDNAEELLEALAARDSRVTVISHSRNFGSQMAFTSGMRQALGDAVILMDGDLQDPPEMIPELVREWVKGYDVVYGIRNRRKEFWPMELMRKLFYRLWQRLSYIPMPLDAGDFSILSRRVVAALLLMPERDRFLRGLRAWVGFRQTGIPYTRAERFAGESTNSMMDNIRWAKRGIFSFSYRPLELISHLALLVMGWALISIGYHLFRFFTGSNPPRGYMTLISVVLLLGAMQLFCLSVIGEYLGRIFEEVKARPPYLIRRILNDHRAAATQEIAKYE